MYRLGCRSRCVQRQPAAASGKESWGMTTMRTLLVEGPPMYTHSGRSGGDTQRRSGRAGGHEWNRRDALNGRFEIKEVHDSSAWQFAVQMGSITEPRDSPNEPHARPPGGFLSALPSRALR